MYIHMYGFRITTEHWLKKVWSLKWNQSTEKEIVPNQYYYHRVTPFVISSDKCSIKILKITKISCRYFSDKIAKFSSR